MIKTMMLASGGGRKTINSVFFNFPLPRNEDKMKIEPSLQVQENWG